MPAACCLLVQLTLEASRQRDHSLTVWCELTDGPLAGTKKRMHLGEKVGLLCLSMACDFHKALFESHRQSRQAADSMSMTQAGVCSGIHRFRSSGHRGRPRCGESGLPPRL
ncbi:hypothetical protein LZ31DRAFT_555029, partial [Colletotrichum somersetense]